MALSLITPLGPNFIKDFPSQNAVNLDRIDDYAGPCLTSQPLQSYTPQLIGTTTSPDVNVAGGGVLRGYFYEIFDQIYTWGEFRFAASGASFGVGTYLISLPFTADTIMGANITLGSAPQIGSGYVHDQDTGANRCPITVSLRTPTQMMFGVKMDNGLGKIVSNNIPFLFAAQDGMSWHARFKRLP